MRKISIISAILITVLLLSSCNSSDKNSKKSSSKSSSSATSAFAASLNATEEAKSYKFTATVKISGDIEGQMSNGEITMSGVSSANGAKSSVTVDLGDLLGDVGDIGGLSLSNADLTIEQRTIDGVAYTKNLDFFGLGEETWTQQDLSELIEAQEAQNPNQYLQYLNAAGDDVEKVGQEKINGVDTTHYRAVITKEKIEKFFNSDEWKQYYEEQGLTEADYEELKGAYSEGLTDTPIDLWVDKDDLPVRMKISTSISSAKVTSNTDGESSVVDSEFTIDFSDWGVAVDVKAPPADQIVTQEQYEQMIKEKFLSQLGA